MNDVKDRVLDRPGDAVRHQRMFLSKSELDRIWQHGNTDPAVAEKLAKVRSAPAAQGVRYSPDSGYEAALRIYLLSGGDPAIAAKAGMLERLRQLLRYDLYGVQFGNAGGTAPIFHDALVDSPVVPEEELAVTSART